MLRKTDQYPNVSLAKPILISKMMTVSKYTRRFLYIYNN